MGAFLSGTATFFSRLMDHSVEISALICLIFFVKWVVAKKLPPWWHYSLWLMLLVRMLVPIEFENQLNIFNFIPDIRERHVFEIITDPSSENEMSAAESTLKTPLNRPNWRVLLKSSIPMLWLAGAMVFGICILFKSISFWRSVRRPPPISDKKVLHLLAQCKNRMNIQAVMDVIVTDKVRSPALFGYFHPRLLLPEGIFESLSDEDLSYAFMHELGHLKRHDIGISWLMAVLQVAYWFNPLVWVAFHQMRIDQESACDESVLSRITHHQSADYAKAIVGFLEKFYRNCQLPSLAGVLENKTQMKRRIANIVHYEKCSRKVMVAAIALFISTGFIFYLFTGVAKEKQTQSVIEKSFVDIKSAVDEKDILSAEIGPVGLSVSQAEITPKPLHLVRGDVSYSNGKTENSNGASRIVKKTDQLSMGPGLQTMPHPPAIMESERKTVTEGYREQPEETRASSLTALIEAASPGSVSPGISPVKPDEDFIEKRGIEANRDVSASASESGPDASVVIPGFNQDRAVHQSETVAQTANGKMMTDAGSEMLPGSKASHPMMKTDGGKDVADVGFWVSDVDKPPRVIRAVPPRYPFMAKRDDIAGYIKLRFIVTKDGDAIDTTVVESSPKGVFDKSALEAIESYRFKPGIKDGKAVDVQVNLPIKFSLS